MIVDFAKLTPSQRYFAMVQTIIPRPIAWVLSANDTVEPDHALLPERFNLAPFSFFTGICSDPPLLMLSVGKKPSGDEAGQVKDTYRNIREQKQFVVHIASCDALMAVNDSAATLNHGDSEVARQGLSLERFGDFSVPRLSGCAVAMGCRLYRVDEIGNAPQAVIYGQIETLFVDDSVITPHSERLVVDGKKLDPLARLGGNFYGNLGELLVANRPK
ncbi:MAG TPA: flavin reductase family protein [Marinagarivorans sp.]